MDSNEILELMSNSVDGVFATRNDNKIIYWNESAQKILGYKTKDVIGKSYRDLISPKDIKGKTIYFQNDKNSKQEKGAENYEIIANSAKSNKVWLNITVFHVPNNSDDHGINVHVFRDITREKIYEKIIIDVISKTDIANHLVSTVPSLKKDNKDHEIKLTNREREILLLLADGHSTKTISSKLYITMSTLRKHIRNIYSKLKVHSMVEALAVARKNNLI